MIRFKIGKSMATAAVIVTLLFPVHLLADEEKAPEKAAVVNDKEISYADFEQRVEMFKQQVLRGNPGQLPDAVQQKLKDQVIQKMITDELLLQRAVKEGLSVDSGVIDNEINKIKSQFKDPSQYAERLKAVGLTDAMLRKQMDEQFTIRKLVEKDIFPKVKVTPDEAKQYYDENKDKFRQPEKVRAQHILMKVEKGDSEEKKTEARKKLKALHKRILAGEDFSTLAKEHSEGPSNVRGGDLGYFPRGRMVKPFEDAAFKLAANEVSDIVETQFGFHLIKVLDHKAESETPFSSVQPKIMSMLFNEKVQEELAPYVENLRKEAKIQVFVK